MAATGRWCARWPAGSPSSCAPRWATWPRTPRAWTGPASASGCRAATRRRVASGRASGGRCASGACGSARRRSRRGSPSTTGAPAPPPSWKHGRMSELTPHARHNQAYWTTQAADSVEPARRHWAAAEPTWGIWEVPESKVGIVPDVAGLDVVELGCGTAYWSAWLARRGRRPAGVDVTPAQLATARELQAEHGLEFPLLEASAEAVPLPDSSFDFALSEYGASLWCEPEAWLAEAARLLRPDGRLVFLTNSVLVVLCSPPGSEVATDRLARPQFGLHRVEWHDAEGPSTEFT